MKIYSEDKKTILENPNVEKGKLVNDKITKHLDEKSYVEKKSHYETIKVYSNGGKDVKEIVDVKGQDFEPAKDYEEEIQVYIPYTKQELEEIKLNKFRTKRESECFPIINRGKLWYDTLTQEQVKELQTWYQAWLDVTETLEVPTKPDWIL